MIYFACNKITGTSLNDRGLIGELGHPRPYRRPQTRGSGEGKKKTLHGVIALLTWNNSDRGKNMWITSVPSVASYTSGNSLVSEKKKNNTVGGPI